MVNCHRIGEKKRRGPVGYADEAARSRTRRDPAVRVPDGKYVVRETPFDNHDETGEPRDDAEPGSRHR